MAWRGIDLSNLAADLTSFVGRQRQTISTAFSTYAQRFEAYCFMVEFERLKAAKANPAFHNPGGSRTIRLKYSATGSPIKYSYVSFTVGGEAMELRHNLLVQSAHDDGYSTDPRDVPGFCLDLAIVRANSLVQDQYVRQFNVLTFHECKNMGAFPELVASFVGLVHEVMPRYVNRIVRPTWFTRRRISPPSLLTASLPTRRARSICANIARRKLCIRVLVYDRASNSLIPL
jgi:hypothetical protein